MYFEQFGLNCPPFEETTNPRFFYESSTHRAALDEITERLRNNGGIILVQGGPGSGKTILSQVLAERLSESGGCLSVSLPPSGPNDLLARICAGYRLKTPNEKCDAEYCITRIVENAVGQSQSCCAVLIDQAENLCTEELITAERLVAAMSKSGIKLGIVLLATNSVDRPLAKPDVSVLTSPVKRVGRISKLTDEEVNSYVKARLQAGGSDKNPFTVDALSRIASESNGRPRRINEIANQALIYAAENHLHKIDEQVVLKCCKENDAMGTNENHDHQEENLKKPADSSLEPVPGIPTTDILSLEPLVRRIEDLFEAAPARLAEMEERIRRMETRADDLVHQANSSGGSRHEEVELLIEEQNDRISETLEKLEKAVSNAHQVENTLKEKSSEFIQVEKSSEERISLLLTSLDTAQQIHHKLEAVGEQVGSLVEDSRESAIEEREHLQDMFDELSIRREELSNMIDSLRAERHGILKENRQAITEQIDQIRAEISDAHAESMNTLKQVREMSTGLKEDHTGLLEDCREKVDVAYKDFYQLRDKITNAGSLARHMLETVDKQTEGYKKKMSEMESAQKVAEATIKGSSEATARMQTTIRRAMLAVKTLSTETESADKLKREAINAIENLGAEITQSVEELNEKAISSIERVGDEIQAAIELQREDSINTIRTVTDDGRESLSEIIDNGKESLNKVVGNGRDSLSRVTDHGKEFFENGLSELEAVIHTQKGARETAENAVRGAQSALATLKESENKLAQAQEYAINIEATASATLCSVQKQIKRVEETVSSVVDHGIEKTVAETEVLLGECRNQIKEATGSLNESIETAVESGSRKHETIKKQIEEAICTAKSIAEQQINKTREESTSTCLDTVDAIRAASTSALVDLNEKTEEAIKQFSDHVQTNTATSAEEIDSVAQGIARNLSQTLREVADKAKERINGTVTSAANTIQEQIASATETASNLRGMDTSGRAILAETKTCKEQIDHMIRDIWSLTTTTHEKMESLSSLNEKAEAIKASIEESVTRADDCAARLEELSNNHKEANELCEEFAREIEEARSICDQLNGANESGKLLENHLAEQASQIDNLVESARDIVDTIHEEEAKANKTTSLVSQLVKVTEGLEPRVQTLQDSLSEPMKIIQNARDQAEELNNVCLAVKRVFRGISQASLEANERVKLLSTVIASADQSTETIKQWVEEGHRAQSRLASTLKYVPSLEDTHPLISIPDLTNGPVPEQLKSQPSININDVAAIRRLADTVKGNQKQKASNIEVAHKDRRTGKPNNGSDERNSSIKADKRSVERKVDQEGGVAVAENPVKTNKAEASVERMNAASVMPGSQTSSRPSAQPKRSRLSPDDIRALIAEAKRKVAGE